jgi:pantoate--beta-alanine ligase
MGALHAGHISLIKRSRRECDVTVCSIFVNPTQFNDPRDYEKYPITLPEDKGILEAAKCEVLFLPTVAEMYPTGTAIAQVHDFGYVATTLEGEFRPGHFDGMAQIVERLLRAVMPDKLYMGQKDYQQAMICRQLLGLLGLTTLLVVCPIKREVDGLAMSSRNIRLSPAARALAVEIVHTLRYIKYTLSHHPTITSEQLQAKAQERLAAYHDINVEYIAVRDASTLRPIHLIDQPAVALIAAQLGGVRLIDNMLL